MCVQKIKSPVVIQNLPALRRNLEGEMIKKYSIPKQFIEAKAGPEIFSNYIVVEYLLL